MGFLKNIGKSLKGVTKMISTKNIVKVATGNATGLGKELVGRTLQPHFSQGQKSPAVVENMADQYVKNVSTKVSNDIAKGLANNSDFQGIAKFGTKLWLQTMWAEHKKTILIVGGVLTLGIIYLVRRKKTGGRTRK